ncbi:hypothetical protein [Streptomyces roseicoloratus]|uniref:Secreted protein n=1 Tax=Streptomyces roseicoloratus TaxID=2508722 RepID=A0ABY9S1L7_9ACTN|nr:hypothetical protein [Streptomyces roseicoloratus]WMX47339.1 hypothetical protein RGF97_24405 [Streptomyces roseicoloratus]
MNTYQRACAAVLLAGAALGLAGAPQALAADSPSAQGQEAGLVDLLNLDEVGRDNKPQASISGNSSDATIGGQVNEQHT